jgi:xylulokinase
MATPTAFFLGIDVARSGLGLVVLAGNGEQVASLHRAYGGGNDQLYDPQDWWRAARTGIKEILRRAKLKPDQIRCIGVTGDGDSLVALSKEGKVLCPSTLGPDPRVTGQIDVLNNTVGVRTLLNLACGTATSGSMAVKLLWLRENEKRVWHDLGVALSAKDFIRFRLCETLVTDASDASMTLLFNPKTRAWSKQLLGALEFNPDWLPTISSGQLISGRVTGTAAREAGLQAGTPVITGGSHAASCAVAAGAIQAGSAMVELGDVGGLFFPTDEALRDNSGALLTTCHTLTGMWALAQPNLAGAESLEWLQQHVFASEVMQARRNQRDALEPMAELAAETPPGADGLFHLSAKQNARLAGFVGMQRHHSRGHLVRAILESGALSVKGAIDALVALKKDPTEILIVGPGSSNTLWCQILADALDRPVHSIPGAESAAIGSAILAGSAVGLYKTITVACEQMVAKRVGYQPRHSATEVYQKMSPIISSLSQITLPNFAVGELIATEVQS